MSETQQELGLPEHSLVPNCATRWSEIGITSVGARKGNSQHTEWRLKNIPPDTYVVRH